MVLKMAMSGAIDALEAAVSALRDQLELANRLIQPVTQAAGQASIATRWQSKPWQSCRLSGTAERTKAKAETRHRPWWWDRLRQPREAA